jgi:hypothetical protein
MGDVRDVLARANDRDRKRKRASRRGRRASSWMGSSTGQPHRDKDVRGRERRQDAGWGTFYGTRPASRRNRSHSARKAKRMRCGMPTTRAAEVGRVTPSAVHRCPRASMERAHGRMNVRWRARPCVTRCAGRSKKPTAGLRISRGASREHTSDPGRFPRRRTFRGPRRQSPL